MNAPNIMTDAETARMIQQQEEYEYQQQQASARHRNIEKVRSRVDNYSDRDAVSNSSNATYSAGTGKREEEKERFIMLINVKQYNTKQYCALLITKTK